MENIKTKSISEVDLVVGMDQDTVLVEISNNQAVVSSRDVAKNFGKEHGKILRSIDDLVSQNWLTKNMFLNLVKNSKPKIQL